MPLMKITTAEGIVLEREIAGPGSRMAALLLDLLILGAIWSVLLIVAAIVSSADPTNSTAIVLGILAGGTFLSFVAYFFVAEWRSSGRTPGKRALGLRVIAQDGSAVRPMQCLLRALLLPIELLPVLLFPTGFLVAMATEHRQRLGDLVAGTIVMREPSARPERSLPDVPQSVGGEEDREALRARAAGVLTAADVDFLRDLLARRELDPERRRQLFVRIGREYAERIGAPGFSDARVFLRMLHDVAGESLARAHA